MKQGAISMKILVCVDGSAQSLRALEEASYIAKGYGTDEITAIHVYENRSIALYGEVAFATREHLEYYAEIEKQEKAKSRKLLDQAVSILEAKGLKVRAILQEGHPASTIAKLATEENFTVIVLGSRGLGGLKKLFLGSVSNAVLQEVNANVYIVK
jgi:nucleotide-binding universal stress UspA family protein